MHGTEDTGRSLRDVDQNLVVGARDDERADDCFCNIDGSVAPLFVVLRLDSSSDDRSKLAGDAVGCRTSVEFVDQNMNARLVQERKRAL